MTRSNVRVFGTTLLLMAIILALILMVVVVLVWTSSSSNNSNNNNGSSSSSSSNNNSSNSNGLLEQYRKDRVVREVPFETISTTTTINPTTTNHNKKKINNHTNHSSLQFPECLTSWCMQQEAAQLARAYSPRTDHDQWCIRTNRTNNNNTTSTTTTTFPNDDPHILRRGWQLVKTYKSASSTAAAVSVRITTQLGCDPRYTHWQHRSGRAFAHRLVNESFLLTSVRDPGSRALSSIFYHYVSFLPLQQHQQQHQQHQQQQHQHQKQQPPGPTTEYLQHRLRTDTRDHPWAATSDGQGGFTLRYVSPHPIAPHSFWNPQQPQRVQQPDQLRAHVRAILQHYDFVLVTGRMEESLVLLALLLHLPIDAVLVMDAKVAGQQHVHVRTRGGTLRCVPLVSPPKTTPPALQAFLDSSEYRAHNAGDWLLYEAASHSLDRTIAHVIGRDRFAAAWRDYRHGRQLVHEQCRDYHVTHLPCSPEGVPQVERSAAHCSIPGRDFGCGYRCVDAVMARVKQEEKLQQQQQQQAEEKEEIPP